MRPTQEQLETVILARVKGRLPEDADMDGAAALAIIKGAGDAAEAILDMLD